MTFLHSFGFEVYRLRESRSEDEFLLFNRTKDKINHYSNTRILQVLIKEFEELEINLRDFVSNELKLTDRQVNIPDMLKEWILEEYKLLDNIGYRPEDKKIIHDEGKDLFNLYRKSEVLKKYKLVKNPDFPLIKRYLMNLVDYDDDAYNWLVHWLANIVQNPARKVPTAVILQGKQGTGKNQLCSEILKTILGNNYGEITQTQLDAEHNDWAFGKQLIFANEVIHNDNKYLVPNKLKNLVSDKYIPLRMMFKAPILIRNYAHVIFSSNTLVPLKLDADDRRYSVFKSKKLPDGKGLYKEFEKNKEKEIAEFAAFLMQLEIDYDLIVEPYQNQARQDLIRFSQNSIEEFISEAFEMGGLDVMAQHLLEEDHSKGLLNESLHFEVIEREGGLFVETSKIYKLYVKFCNDAGYQSKFSRNNFTKHLKFMGYEDARIKYQGETLRCIRITGGEAQ